MKIVNVLYGPIRSSFDPETPRRVMRIIDEATSAYKPNYYFNPFYEAGQWDGKTHLLWKKSKSRKRAKIPSGLLTLIAEVLKENGYKLKIEGAPNLAPIPLNKNLILPRGEKIRSYQIESCEAFLNSPWKRGLLRVGTGGGKTIMAAALSRSFFDQDKLVLGLIHGNSLLNQTHKKFTSYLKPIPIGMIGNKNATVHPITLASIDTIYSWLKKGNKGIREYLSRVNFVWCDEVHHASSMLWTEVLKAINADARLGLSGTPLKNEELADLQLVAWTGPLVADVSSSYLQDKGYLAQARLTVIENREPYAEPHMDWRLVQKKLIVRNDVRNQKIADIAIARAKMGKSVMILTGGSRRLCYRLFRLIEPEYAGVEIATGLHGVYHNDRALRHLRTDVVKIVVGTTIFDEGIDVPSLDVVIFCNAGKSFVKTIQRIGRGLRPKDDGGTLELVDFMDLNHKYLRNHSRKRLEIYEEENLFIDVRFFESHDFSKALEINDGAA